MPCICENESLAEWNVCLNGLANAIIDRKALSSVTYYCFEEISNIFLLNSKLVWSAFSSLSLALSSRNAKLCHQNETKATCFHRLWARYVVSLHVNREYRWIPLSVVIIISAMTLCNMNIISSLLSHWMTSHIK
jgi:hypothetical protein